MIHIGRNYHMIHMTGDLIALETWYDHIFGVSNHQWHGNNYDPADTRDAELELIGTLVIEPVAPAMRIEGWERSPIGRFYKEFGERWHSIAFLVEDGMPELYQRLKSHGIRVIGQGHPIDDKHPEEIHGLFTHPLDTFTMLQFSLARPDDPRAKPGFDPSWIVEHPLGAINSSHMTVKVPDLEKAKKLYVDAVGGTLLHEGEQKLMQTKSAFVAIGTDTIVELAQPLNKTSMIGQDMDKWHPGMFAVTLKVTDLNKTEKYLTSKGIKVALKDRNTIVCDPATTHNAVWAFTTWDIPGDTRKPWAK